MSIKKNYFYIKPSEVINGKKAKNAIQKNAGLPIGLNQAICSLDILKTDAKKKLVFSKRIKINTFNNWKKKLNRNNLIAVNKAFHNIKKLHTNMNFDILPKESPIIMGIVNITEDSFYDGGKYFSSQKAIRKAKKLISEGAHIIDIGGESTKPFSKPISANLEIKRVIPVIKELTNRNILISCDTRNSKTIKEAILAGADIINDTSGLEHDNRTLHILAESNCLYILNHCPSDPTIMQNNPKYINPSLEVLDYLESKIKLLEKHKVNKNRIIIDPGIGFGKLDKHNFHILSYLLILMNLGCPVLVGVSRKSLIGRKHCNVEPNKRLPGSLALAIHAYMNGARILRVHDVKETIQAISLFKAVNIEI